MAATAARSTATWGPPTSRPSLGKVDYGNSTATWLEQDPEFWQEGVFGRILGQALAVADAAVLFGDSPGVSTRWAGRTSRRRAPARLAFTEVQTLTLKPGTTSGSFRLGVDGARSDPITLLRVGQSEADPKPQNPKTPHLVLLNIIPVIKINTCFH
jgi:hypothetical protein